MNGIHGLGVLPHGPYIAACGLRGPYHPSHGQEPAKAQRIRTALMILFRPRISASCYHGAEARVQDRADNNPLID